MAEINVIKSFREKNESGSYNNPSFFGTEVRFVGPLRGCNNNNLEEQMLIGVDCVTTQWVDDEGVERITKEYHDSSEEEPTGYYILDTYIYDQEAQQSEFYFENEALSVPDDTSLQDIREDENDELTFYGEDNEVYSYANMQREMLIDPDFVLVRKDILQYKQANGDIINISTKTTQLKYTTDGNRQVVKETITNHL